MTELIVALDGPEPLKLMRELFWFSAVNWFKIGPAAMCSHDFAEIVAWADSLNIFLDLKLADTADTVRTAVKRFADNRVAAVSTFTDAATEAALRASEGTPLKIWRIARLSDAGGPITLRGLMPAGHGIVCPVAVADRYLGMDTICPGIRRSHDDRNGHVNVATPRAAVLAGATYAVVGRPIWTADDPVRQAREFIMELRDG